MRAFEKAGLFYIGKKFDVETRTTTEDFLLYDSKNLTTHAVCVGMTGSGKTGLGIALLEEAALDKIPAIIIDPKGDLGNLLLTFPNLSPQEFKPWVDPAEAERNGLSIDAYAEQMANIWKKGLASWDEDSNRIKDLRRSVKMVIYTPASHAGIPLSIVSSFEAPSKDFVQDSSAMRDRVLSVTSSLLGLLGFNADPIQSRDHILISTIIDQAWRKGEDLDIPTLIQQVQKPSFQKIGALDIDTFFPAKERIALAVSLNNLLASPGFQAWMEGEPLDIQKLLYTQEGQPKLSVISIAHLSEAERLFFVTLLLNQILTWMRRQPGTSSLRAILYMDEIFGFFPPISMPPTKLPMITLLKQARAYGLGIVLATQNPVDLDYKGLSNCGTWFIGKLQTERDKARVIEGLTLASNGEINSKALDKMIAATGKRIFIMRSIYEKEPVLFETRWTMSYLRGPLTLAQIQALTDKKVAAIEPELFQPKRSPKPIIGPNVPEYFASRPNVPRPSWYKPLVAGFAKLHFVDAKNKIDTWKDVCLIAGPSEDGTNILWEEGERMPQVKNQLSQSPQSDAGFEELPINFATEKNFASFAKSLAATLYQNETLSFFQYPDLGLSSKEDETEGEFRTRVSLALREKRDGTVAELREKYDQKIRALKEKVRRAQDKAALQRQKATLTKAEGFLSMIFTFLGSLFGRGITKGTISSAGTSMRRMGRIGKDSQVAASAEENCEALEAQLENLKEEKLDEIAKISLVEDPSQIKLETLSIKPRKSDLFVDKVVLLWWPIP